MSFTPKLKTLVIASVALAAAAMAAQAEPLNIRVGWSQTPGHMAPLLFQNKSILKHYGKTYTVDPVRFRGSTAQLQALAAGQLEFAALSATALALVINNAGVDAQVVADVIQDHPPGWSSPFVVLNSSGIKKIEDLKGKRIGTNSIGSAIDTAMRVMLRKNGLNNNDFNTIETSFGNMVAMLKEGKVDMAPILPQFWALLDKSTVTKLFTTRDAVGEQQTVSLVGNKAYIAKNRAALVDFFEDYIRALHWFLAPANRDAALKIVMDVTKAPLNRIDYAFTEDDYFRDLDGKPNIPALKNAIQVSLDNNILKKGIDVDKHVDLSLIEEARKRIKD